MQDSITLVVVPGQMPQIDIARCKKGVSYGSNELVFGKGGGKGLDEILVKLQVAKGTGITSDYGFGEMSAGTDIFGLLIIYQAVQHRHGWRQRLLGDKIIAFDASLLMPGRDLRGNNPERHVEYGIGELLKLLELYKMTGTPVRAVYFGDTQYLTSYIMRFPGQPIRVMNKAKA